MKKLLLLSVLLLLINLLSAQWTQQDAGFLVGTEKLNDIFFINQNHGWVVGDYTDTISQKVSCLITTNGGIDWEDSWTWMYGSASTVFFTDESNGWIGGENGQIEHTDNGGSGELVNWFPQETTITYNIECIFFLDSLRGWAIADNWSGVTVGNLISTTDGGLTWTHHINNNIYNWPRDIHFIDADSGWVVGWYGPQFSIDGGMTWEDKYIDAFKGTSLSLTSGNTIWLAGCSQYYPHYGKIYKSNNWGNTWDMVLSDTISKLNDIVFVNEDTGWAVGDSGTILYTQDGGESWEYQESGTKADLHSISFADENHGWICGDSSIILHTNNGGITGIQTSGSKRLTEVKIYPNPVSNNCTIEFNLKQQSHVAIQIFNNLGETIYELENKVFHSGSNKVCWNARDLKKGIYLCKIQIGKETISKKIIKGN